MLSNIIKLNNKISLKISSSSSLTSSFSSSLSLSSSNSFQKSFKRYFNISSRYHLIIKPFLLADIGEGIAEVELMNWYVKVGNKIKSFDKVCEVQSDKATVEITSKYDGIITKIYHKEGDIVKVGTALIDVDVEDIENKETIQNSKVDNNNEITSKKQTINQTINNQIPSKPFLLADIGEGIAEVELMNWYVKVGDVVKAFDKICEVQSDKATVEITSRYDGVITTVHHNIGDIVKVGSALVDIRSLEDSSSTNSETTQSAPSSTHQQSTSQSSSNHQSFKVSNGPVLTTPAVRKIAKENSIDLHRLQGTGPKGRILKEDVLNFLNGSKTYVDVNNSSKQSTDTKVSSTSTSIPSSSTTSTIATGSTISSKSNKDTQTIVPIRGVQRLMVKSMTAALDIPHMGYSEEIIMDSLINLRKQLKEGLDRKGHSKVKLSYMPFILKATSLALTEFPMLNATLNKEVTEMTYHSNHNIGVAMDTPKGLIVPVIKEIQNMSIIEIANELSHLQELASKGGLTEAHLSGGTFSLSNIGSIGGTYTSPIIVVPQVAIGAMGRFQVVPRYVGKNGKQVSSDEIYNGNAIISPTTIMNISWAADHRVIDGATIARFSNSWKSYIETPTLMLGSMK